MPWLISNIKLNKLEWFSLVDKGASGDKNNRAKIVLWKRFEKQEPNTMTLDEILARLSEEEKAVILQALQTAGGPVAQPMPQPVVAAAPPPPPAEPKPGEPEELKKAKKDLELEKAKSDEAKGELVELQKQVTDLKEASRTLHFEKKAKELEYLPMPQTKLVSLLKKADDIGGEEGKELVDMLIRVNKASKVSPILEEYGTSQEDGIVTPLQKQHNLVKELQKANPKLSLEQAKVQVWKAYPELYQQIQNEENGQ